MLCILSYGARPLKKETDVERKYTLALFPESSDWTKAEVTPRRIRLISAVVRANLFPLFFSPPSLPEKKTWFQHWVFVGAILKSRHRLNRMECLTRRDMRQECVAIWLEV